MTEDRFDKLEKLDDLDRRIDSARESYHEVPEPPLDEMWRAIDAELDARSGGARVQPSRRMEWRAVGMAAAAALMIGVGVGRWSARDVPVTVAPVLASVNDSTLTPVYQAGLAEPLQRAATNYFGETAALLKDMQDHPQGAYARQASALLSTTRLLLDSPAASDARLHDLLEDLEMVFAQIAMLRTNESTARRSQDLQMINTALEQRDLVPRVRTAVVTLASSEED